MATKRRPGAGRKPKAFTVLKNRIEAERADDAEYAFALYASVMRDDKQLLPLRLQCAAEIMDRVLGKPTQKNELAGKDGAELVIRYINDWRNPTADTARRTDSGDASGKPV